MLCLKQPGWSFMMDFDVLNRKWGLHLRGVGCPGHVFIPLHWHWHPILDSKLWSRNQSSYKSKSSYIKQAQVSAEPGQTWDWHEGNGSNTRPREMGHNCPLGSSLILGLKPPGACKHCENTQQLFWIARGGFASWFSTVSLFLVQKQAPVSTIFINRFKMVLA